jgi:hypothetical protein
MDICNVKITDIKLYQNNPRRNGKAVAAVAASIKEFGWRAPIVVDREMVIICGHTRLKAAQKLGLSEVPVHIAKDLTPEQIRAYRLADNSDIYIKQGRINQKLFICRHSDRTVTAVYVNSDNRAVRSYIYTNRSKRQVDKFIESRKEGFEKA